MTLVQVRDVPERTVAALKSLAAEEGLTLSAFLRAELERLARRPTNAEIVRRMANRDRSGGPIDRGHGRRDTAGPGHSVIVIECSAMVDALVGSPANPELLEIVANEELHSPSLLDYEASALRGHLLGGLLNATAADNAIQDFSALRIERYELTGLLHDVFALRDNFAAYDAAYIVLARALDAPLLTVDAKLREAKRFGVDVRVCR